MTKLTAENTTIRRNRRLSDNYYSLTLGPYSRAGRCRPGHFIHIQLPHSGVFFRRAMSVASADMGRNEIEILLKVVGRGTSALSGYGRNTGVNILGPLGVPFTLPKRGETCLMIAGGIGFPPLLYLATDMLRRGFAPRSIVFFYGARTSSDIVERSRLKKLGVSLRLVTEDGSLGREGLVTEEVERYLDTCRDGKLRIFSCGPEPMLRAVDTLGLQHGVPGQLSLEAPMPCGIGVCLGCVVALRKGGHARVCCDGPVFDIGEVLL